MKLRWTEINQILQDEIIWCLDHPDKDLNNDQMTGFMNGLRQAQYIIRAAENALCNEVPLPKTPVAHWGCK